MSMCPEPNPQPGTRRYLEAVTVCDRYSDFLTETLPAMRRVVDNLVVVTAKEDGATKKLCAKMDVQCIDGWNHRRDGFDKAKAINHGLAHLGCRDYLMHLDSDIFLPDVADDWFRYSNTLSPDKIYGVDRFDCKSKATLDKVLASGWGHARKEWRYMIQPPQGLRFGTRVGHGDYEGWLPIGFFQLWHSKVKTRYPNKPGSDAEHTDLLHASYWKPEDRILIPDFFCIHLSTTNVAGANWQGRKSPEWK